MIKVIKPGLETSVQDYPGRLGYRNQGFPVSGPFDGWSFRLANLLVGNQAGAAALEAQFIGPELCFEKDTIFAITGADMQAKLNGKVVPMNESIQVEKHMVLSMSFALTGARTYIAFSGGIDSEPWLGSQSTFHKAGVGGIEGRALTVNSKINLKGNDKSVAGKKVKNDCLPIIKADNVSRDHKQWEIEVVAGPNDDWIDEAGHEMFLTSTWKLDAKSDRTGFRLKGPEWTFTDKATNKLPENGSDPANIIDQGYPTGAINLAGQTPVILVSDGPSMGGFICPYTVPTCTFYKLAQSRPSDTYNFKKISVDKSQEIMRLINEKCSLASIY